MFVVTLLWAISFLGCVRITRGSPYIVTTAEGGDFVAANSPSQIQPIVPEPFIIIPGSQLDTDTTTKPERFTCLNNIIVFAVDDVNPLKLLVQIITQLSLKDKPECTLDWDDGQTDDVVFKNTTTMEVNHTYSASGIYRNELDEIKTLWNLHPIRRTRNDQLAHGRPVFMFSSPNEYGTHDYLRPIADPYIEACKEECTLKDNIFCDHDVNELCLLLMQEHGWNKAVDARSGRELYKNLREKIDTVL